MKTETQCLHAGYTPKNGEPRVLPVVQSTTFTYDSTAEVARLFDLEETGFFYSRIGNPTVDAVEKKIAALEGGVGALCTSSGQAAVLLAALNLARCGDHIVSAASIYGGTHNLFDVTLRRFGIETTFVDQDASDEELARAFRPTTRLVYGETLANPALSVLDIERFARLAHARGLPLLVDNTFATPVLCRPMAFGADIVIHSTTKYMDGHAAAVGGVIVDSGNFDWEAHKDKFPGLTEPDPSYHGLSYSKSFGKGAYITKATVQLMRDLGSIQSPQNAFLLNLGLETLHLRVPRHCENAQKVAEFLQGQEDVAWINYPGLSSNEYYELAQKQFRGGQSCGVVTFGIKGGRERSIKFMDSLKLAAIVTHVADSRTCVLHPASHTHRQLTDEQLMEAGVRPDLIRFSVGTEAAEDIIADLKQALEAIR